MTRTRRDSQGLRVGYDVDLKDPYKTDTRRENNDESTVHNRPVQESDNNNN